MHKSTVFRKLAKLGIDLPNQDGRSPVALAET
jgi:hypothetical protein